MIFRLVAVRTILCLIPFVLARGQADRPLEWRRALRDVLADSERSESGDAVEDGRVRIAAIRREIEEWLALHSVSTVTLPEYRPPPWTLDQLRSQIAALKDAVEALPRSIPGNPFDLGLTVVNVTDSASVLSPVFDTLERAEIQAHDTLTVNQAITYLPGVAVDHKSPRNQTGISIGGFDSRQIPLFLDGIPAYVPFDGYVDLTRYLTADIAEIQVAKLYSSPLLGPNTLGGAINLVTRQPQEKLEADAFIGTGSGSLLNSGLRLGSRWRRFFFQGSLNWLQSNFYPISGTFPINAFQPDDHRVNSYQRDEQFGGRVGWTPRTQDSYVLSYSNQKGNTGIPPYSGTAPLCPAGNATVSFPCVTPKYWSWPRWNSSSYYFNSNTAVGESSSVRVRAFYEQFPNILEMFDDSTYTSMNKPSSGILTYEDHSTGVSGEFDTRLVPHNALGASFFVNRDTHQEQTTTFAANVPTATPRQTDRDLQSSFGVQDLITFIPKVRVTAGFSADNLDGLQAQDLNSAKTALIPFQVTGMCPAPTNGSFTSCTDHVWSYNPVGSVSYATTKSGTLFVTFAEKSRFPTLKDRYSYKAGKAIPNPLLHPEHAQNWNAGYNRTLGRRTMLQADFFHSNVRDEIENIFFLSPLCAGGGKGGTGSCQQAVNVSRETHEGADFTFRTSLASRVTFDAGYTFLNRKIYGAPGVFPVGTPRHKTVGTAVVRLPHGATGMISAQYQSGAVAMSDNSLPLPAAKFATFDLGGAVPIAAGISVQAGLKNLLDRNYYYWEGFPEAGRNWYITVRYRF